MSLQAKALQMVETHGGKLLEIRISGKLQKPDYELLVPEVERLIEAHGGIRMLVHLEDFQGWSVGALWEDIKFDLRHFGDIEPLALVGEEKWEQGMAAFCKPFTKAEVRYYPPERGGEARDWVREGLGPET